MHAAKIYEYIEQHLSGRAAESPPPEFPVTSQVRGELRELRVRFGRTRYRVLYQRSGSLIVLLHAFAKKTGAVPVSEQTVAQRRMATSDSVWTPNLESRRAPPAGTRHGKGRKTHDLSLWINSPHA